MWETCGADPSLHRAATCVVVQDSARYGSTTVGGDSRKQPFAYDDYGVLPASLHVTRNKDEPSGRRGYVDCRCAWLLTAARRRRTCLGCICRMAQRSRSPTTSRHAVGCIARLAGVSDHCCRRTAGWTPAPQQPSAVRRQPDPHRLTFARSGASTDAAGLFRAPRWRACYAQSETRHARHQQRHYACSAPRVGPTGYCCGEPRARRDAGNVAWSCDSDTGRPLAPPASSAVIAFIGWRSSDCTARSSKNDWPPSVSPLVERLDSPARGKPGSPDVQKGGLNCASSTRATAAVHLTSLRHPRTRRYDPGRGGPRGGALGRSGTSRRTIWRASTLASRDGRAARPFLGEGGRLASAGTVERACSAPVDSAHPARTSSAVGLSTSWFDSAGRCHGAGDQRWADGWQW